MRELSTDPKMPEEPDPGNGSGPLPFRLGAWRVEPLLHRLERPQTNGDGNRNGAPNGSGSSRHLTPKAMEVLLSLASRGNGAVTRRELLDAVWPETHVGEEVLTRAISDLRAALGDDRREPRYIETIPKVGYRLIAEVELLSPPPVRDLQNLGQVPGEDGTPWEGRSDAASDNLYPGSPKQGSAGWDPLAGSSVGSGSPGEGSLHRRSLGANPLGKGSFRRGSTGLGFLRLRSLGGRRGGTVRLAVGLIMGTAMLALAWSSWNGMPQSPTSGTWAAPPPAAPPRDAIPPTAATLAAAPLAATPLTTFPGFESSAEISPDGRRVAFVRSSSDGSEADLYVMPSAGGEAHRLTEGPAAEAGPTWSPDGRRLAFQRYVGDGCSILEISAEGGPERHLGSCGANVTGDLAWSPSGEWLAFSDRSSPEGPMGIFLLSTLTGERRKLVAPDGEHWGDHTPAFSPDGRQLAFVRSVSLGTQDVYRISLLDPEALAVPVTHDAASIRGHAWLPDGSGLVVSSRRTGARGLWQVSLDGSLPRWIPLASGHAWYPSLARRTGQVIFEDRVLESTLQGLSLGSAAEGAPWLPSTREDLMPAHSPDGRRVAFASNRSGPFEIWVAGADGSHAEQVTALAGAFNGSPRWTPDGTAIVFDARLDGQADVYRVTPGSKPVRLTDNPANDLAPSVSPDGRFLYFGSNRSGRWQIWRQPADEILAEAMPVTRNGGYRALAGADGDTLYLTRYGEKGLFRHSLSTGATEALAGTEDLLGSEQWTVADGALYFLARQRGGGPASLLLYRLHPPTGPELVTDLGRRQFMTGLSVAPDRETILYAELTRREADLWRIDADFAPGAGEGRGRPE